MKIKLCFFVIVIGFLIWPIFCFGANSENHLLIIEIQIAGDKASYDFIKIYNPSDFPIDIKGYQLKKRVQKGTESSIRVFSEGSIIPAKGCVLWASSKDNYDSLVETNISSISYLSQDNSIALLDTDKKIIDALAWGSGHINPFIEGSPFPQNPDKNQTLKRKILDDAIYQDTGNNKEDFKLGTLPEFPSSEEPEEEPEITTTGPAPTNQPPQADAGQDVVALTNTEIVFDGSNSADPENDSLTYFWNFGDGQTADQIKVSHIYQYPGTYIITLTVNDGQNSSTDIIKVSIYSQAIVISEFLPSPAGKDEENEWLEIQNQSDQIADLSGWQIKDAGSQSGFTFPEHSLIEAQSYLVLKRQTTKIALNNDQDTLSLFYPTGDLAQEISYEDAKEGYSINFVSANQYVWSTTPSPGMPNLITGDKKETSQTEILEKLSQVEEVKEEIGLSLNLPQFTSLVTRPEKELSNLLNLLPQPVIAQVTEPSIEQISESLAQSLEEKESLTQQFSSKDTEQTAALGTRLNKNPEIILILTLILSSGLFGLWLVQIRKKFKMES